MQHDPDQNRAGKSPDLEQVAVPHAIRREMGKHTLQTVDSITLLARVNR